MAWEWSHTQEAYGNARRNLEGKSREWLNEVFGEWRAESDRLVFHRRPIADFCDNGGFDGEAYDAALLLAVDLPDEALIEEIWERMSSQRTCDNGGFNAWACPSGCHTISFSPSE
jgi:hypothetical protein